MLYPSNFLILATLLATRLQHAQSYVIKALDTNRQLFFSFRTSVSVLLFLHFSIFHLSRKESEVCGTNNTKTIVEKFSLNMCISTLQLYCTLRGSAHNLYNSHKTGHASTTSHMNCSTDSNLHVATYKKKGVNGCEPLRDS